MQLMVQILCLIWIFVAIEEFIHEEIKGDKDIVGNALKALGWPWQWLTLWWQRGDPTE